MSRRRFAILLLACAWALMAWNPTDALSAQQPIEGTVCPPGRLSFTSDGHLLAVEADSLRLWKADDGELIGAYSDFSAWIRSAAISPDGLRVASADVDGVISIIHLEERGRSQSLTTPGHSVYGLAFSGDGRRLAAAGPQGLVLWDLETGTAESLTPAVPGLRRLIFSPDGNYLAGAGRGGGAHVWRLKAPLSNLRLPIEQEADAVAFDASSRHLSILVHDKRRRISILCWDLDGQRFSKPRRLTFRGIPSAWAWSGDGRTLAVATLDGFVTLVQESSRMLFRHAQPARFLAFSPDGRYLFSAGEDLRLAVWDVDEERIVALHDERFLGPATALDMSSQGRLLSAHWGSLLGSSLLLRDRDGRVVTALNAPAAGLMAADWDAADRRLSWITSDADLKQVERGRTQPTLMASRLAEKVSAAALDGRRLALGLEDGRVMTAALPELRLVEARRHPSALTRLKWTSQGLLSLGSDGSIHFEDGRLMQLPVVDGTGVLADFAADRVVIEGKGRLRIWKRGADSPSLEQTLPRPQGVLRALSFSDDGRHLVAASSMEAQAWTLSPKGTWRRDARVEGDFCQVTLSPDGSRRALRHRDGRIQVFGPGDSIRSMPETRPVFALRTKSRPTGRLDETALHDIVLEADASCGTSSDGLCRTRRGFLVLRFGGKGWTASTRLGQDAGGMHFSHPGILSSRATRLLDARSLALEVLPGVDLASGDRIRLSGLTLSSTEAFQGGEDSKTARASGVMLQAAVLDADLTVEVVARPHTLARFSAHVARVAHPADVSRR